MKKISKDFIKFRQHIRTLNLSVNEQYLLELFFEFHNANYGYCFLKVSDILKAFNTTSKNRVSNVIKSLEEKKLIVVNREYKNNRYTLVGVEEFLNTTEEKEQKKIAPKVGVDSNGEKPLPNQITVEEVLQEAKSKELTLEEQIVEATGCTPEVAKASVEYAKQQGANNIKAYAIASINKGFTGSNLVNGINAMKFNNFEPREYDYDSLEKKLLGWDNTNLEEFEEIQESKGYDFLREYGIGSAIAN